MTISVITATYNSALTLRDTLESVRRQSYPNIEHLVIDGASIDHTLSIVSEYPHISKIISEKDNGIYDAMNKGLRLASGDIIGILNSDDVYNNDLVLTKVAEAFDDASIDVVYGDLQYVKPGDLNAITRTWISGHYNKNKFYYGWMPPHPCFFVRKAVYEKVGLFNIDLRSAADYELMLRILLRYELTPRYIPQFLVRMRTGGISNASYKNRIAANREDLEAWRVNNIQPYWFTILLKPLRKIFQFIDR